MVGTLVALACSPDRPREHVDEPHSDVEVATAEDSSDTDDTESGADSADVPADADGDGFDAQADCNDADATVYPGASDPCDSIDQDCDGDPVGSGSCGELIDFDSLAWPQWTGASAGAHATGGWAGAFDGGGALFFTSYTENPIGDAWGAECFSRAMAPATGWWRDDAEACWAGEPWYDHLNGGGLAGDFDGDGNDDVVLLSTGQSDCCDGGIFVMLGPPERWPRDGAYLRESADGWWKEAIPDWDFGRDLDIGHDIDGDGRTDVVVHAGGDIFDQEGGDNGGSTYVIYGREAELPWERSVGDEVELFEATGGENDQGEHVRVGPDIDGDGWLELLRFQPEGAFGPLSGATLNGADGATLDDLVTPLAAAEEGAVVQAPRRSATIGDLTGDGLDDVLWYEWDDVDAGTEWQCLRIGDAAGFATAENLGAVVFASACEYSSDVLPGEWNSVTDYDVDDDGRPDVLMVTSLPFDTSSNPTSDAFGWLTSGTLSAGGTYDIAEFGPFYSTLGGPVPGAADLDRDGFPEIVIADSRWDSGADEDVGRVQVIPGFDIPYDDATKW